METSNFAVDEFRRPILFIKNPEVFFMKLAKKYKKSQFDIVQNYIKYNERKKLQMLNFYQKLAVISLQSIVFIFVVSALKGVLQTKTYQIFYSCLITKKLIFVQTIGQTFIFLACVI